MLDEQQQLCRQAAVAAQAMSYRSPKTHLDCSCSKSVGKGSPSTDAGYKMSPEKQIRSRLSCRS